MAQVHIDREQFDQVIRLLVQIRDGQGSQDGTDLKALVVRAQKIVANLQAVTKNLESLEQ